MKFPKHRVFLLLGVDTHRGAHFDQEQVGRVT